MKVKIAFIGVGGYAAYLQKLLRTHVQEDSFEIVCGADPFYEKSEAYPELKEKSVPLYRTPEEMFSNHKVDLTIVVSPLHFHKKHILLALENDTHILCEKPLATTVQDALEIQEAALSKNKKLGVGFQWSFSPTMLALKKDILSGELGRPLALKSFVAWKRYDSYYQGSWKGDLKSKDGDWILDCVVTNATAHYLHNMLFLLGDTIDTAALPTTTFTEIYRQKDIETFDTCFIKGRFENGCELFFCASHSPEINDSPKFVYEFENGTVYMNIYERGSKVTLYRKDGTTKLYGTPETEIENSNKLKMMIAAVAENAPIPCGVDTILPHLKICNAMFEEATIHPFVSDRIYCEKDGESGRFVYGLYNEMEKSFVNGMLPSELGFSWAKGKEAIHPEKMEFFEGL